MFTKEQNELFMNCVKNFKIPEKHQKNIFWCPKEIEGAAGAVLYIYGGHALDMRFTKNGLSARIFSSRYCKYFVTEKRGRDIRKEFTEKNRYHKGISVLESWSEGIWDEICCACYAWATKNRNSEYERMRQTRICNDNMFNSEFFIFTMEEMIPVENRKPEVDMVAIRVEDGKTILSYIEYKCTESATKGKISLAEHYTDMAKLSMNDANTERMLQLYYQKQQMLGNDVKQVSAKECKKEIIFLISDVQYNEKVKKNQTGKMVSAKTVHDKLVQTSMREDFREDDVKVLFMGAVDVDSDKKYVLQKENFMTVTEAIEKLNG